VDKTLYTSCLIRVTAWASKDIDNKVAKVRKLEEEITKTIENS
jgi:hypothetical protein